MPKSPGTSRRPSLEGRLRSSPGSARRLANPSAEQLLEKVCSLEASKRSAEREKRQEKIQRQRALSEVKKRINQEIATASKDMRKSESVVIKMESQISQLEKQEQQFGTWKARQIEYLDSRISKLRSSQSALEDALQEEALTMGEARGRLEHARMAAQMLRKGVDVAAVAKPVGGLEVLAAKLVERAAAEDVQEDASNMLEGDRMSKLVEKLLVENILVHEENKGLQERLEREAPRPKHWSLEVEVEDLAESTDAGPDSSVSPSSPSDLSSEPCSARPLPTSSQSSQVQQQRRKSSDKQDSSVSPSSPSDLSSEPRSARPLPTSSQSSQVDYVQAWSSARVNPPKDWSTGSVPDCTADGGVDAGGDSVKVGAKREDLASVSAAPEPSPTALSSITASADAAVAVVTAVAELAANDPLMRSQRSLRRSPTPSVSKRGSASSEATFPAGTVIYPGKASPRHQGLTRVASQTPANGIRDTAALAAEECCRYASPKPVVRAGEAKPLAKPFTARSSPVAWRAPSVVRGRVPATGSLPQAVPVQFQSEAACCQSLTPTASQRVALQPSVVLSQASVINVRMLPAAGAASHTSAANALPGDRHQVTAQRAAMQVKPIATPQAVLQAEAISPVRFSAKGSRGCHGLPSARVVRGSEPSTSVLTTAERRCAGDEVLSPASASILKVKEAEQSSLWSQLLEDDAQTATPGSQKTLPPAQAVHLAAASSSLEISSLSAAEVDAASDALSSTARGIDIGEVKGDVESSKPTPTPQKRCSSLSSVVHKLTARALQEYREAHSNDS